MDSRLQRAGMTSMYEIEIIGLEEQIALLDRYDDIAIKELEHAMTISAKAIAYEASFGAPRWRGNLADSMTSRVTSFGSQVVGEVRSSITNSPYPLVMEYGRRAGAKPPPVAAIRPWVADKLGDASLAFVVARSIGRKGIKPRKFLWKAFLARQADVVALFQRAVENIAAKLAVKA